MAKAFLVDGTAFCYRAFYAIRALSTADGRPTNAVYGFAMMLNALRNTQHPDYLAVAFDAGKPTFRHARFEDYKAQRKPMPDPLIGQLPLIKELLAAYRVFCIEQEGYEAEDLLATMARRIVRQGLEVFLVTGDKDALQLVNERVKVYNPHKDHVVLDHQKVVERYGVPPERMVDLMALMGDEIDNIPGVPGIGEKTASTLLQRFGTLEGLYTHLDDVSNASLRAALRQHREQVELAQELARIDTEVPLSVDLEALTVREPDWRKLRTLFRDLEFKRLLADIEADAPSPSLHPVRVRLVTDQQRAGLLRQQLSSVKPAAVASVETATARGWLAFVWDVDEAWLLPIPDGLPAVKEALRSWLASPRHPKVGHDLKRTVRWLRMMGWEIDGISGDTMVASYLLNPSRTSPTLQDIAEERLELRVPRIPVPDAAAEEMGQALAHHARIPLQLHELLEDALRKVQLDRLYHELELPLVRVLAEMESVGVAIDRTLLDAMRDQMAVTLSKLAEQLHRLAGCEFNLNSPKQLAEILFQRLQLPVIKRTKTGPSTDIDVLQRLASLHPFPKTLIDYRETAKLISTYLEALPQLIHPDTGRLHSTFHQTGTATGRLSSSDPNLQNIPIKTELGRQIRRAFIPGPPGWSMMAADYSQVELRILAHFSEDPELIDVFQHDRDIHRHTAALVYGVTEQDVTPQMRSAMKAVNFGILYGMSAHGLARELEIPHEQAASFIEAYFARYPTVRGFLDSQIQHATRDGFVQTLLGRRRYIPEINSPDGAIRQFGERMAVNAPIQGTAADLIKLAMVSVARALRERGMASRMILQVHDELVFEVPPQEHDEMAGLVRDLMERAIALRVPLRVTVKAGPNWLDLTPVEPRIV